MPRKVPLVLLRRLCYPTGYRLPHVERLLYPEPKDAVPVPPITYSDHTGYASRGAVVIPPGLPAPSPGTNLNKSLLGNLPLQEYRFFSGRDSDVSEVARCRWCGLALVGKAQREAHRKGNNCPENMTVVYQRMRQLKRCAICDGKTELCKWGVPLCSPGCTREFMFCNPTSVIFVVAEFKAEICKVKNAL